MGDTTATPGLPALMQEQIDTWSRQQKDAWWLTTVYRGDMAQTTFRSAPTGTTPTGSLSKIPQCTFGALEPRHPPTNLMTGVMCVEVASNASNLLMDMKRGYVLGAEPRSETRGHMIFVQTVEPICAGLIAGAALIGIGDQLIKVFLL